MNENQNPLDPKDLQQVKPQKLLRFVNGWERLDVPVLLFIQNNKSGMLRIQLWSTDRIHLDWIYLYQIKPKTEHVPQENGQVERINAIVMATLANLSVGMPSKWYVNVSML